MRKDVRATQRALGSKEGRGSYVRKEGAAGGTVRLQRLLPRRNLVVAEADDARELVVAHGQSLRDLSRGLVAPHVQLRAQPAVRRVTQHRVAAWARLGLQPGCMWVRPAMDAVAAYGCYGCRQRVLRLQAGVATGVAYGCSLLVQPTGCSLRCVRLQARTWA